MAFVSLVAAYSDSITLTYAIRKCKILNSEQLHELPIHHTSEKIHEEITNIQSPWFVRTQLYYNVVQAGPLVWKKN